MIRALSGNQCLCSTTRWTAAVLRETKNTSSERDFTHNRPSRVTGRQKRLTATPVGRMAVMAPFHNVSRLLSEIHNMPRCQTDPIRTGSASPRCSIVAIQKVLRPRRVRRAEQCNESESRPARSPRRLFGFGPGRTVLVTQGTPMSNRYWTLLATIASR
jgi:hypothetical protein